MTSQGASFWARAARAGLHDRLAVSGQTYNRQPLMYVALGSQKRHIGLYLCGLSCVAGQEGGAGAPMRAAEEAEWRSSPS